MNHGTTTPILLAAALLALAVIPALAASSCAARRGQDPAPQPAPALAPAVEKALAALPPELAASAKAAILASPQRFDTLLAEALAEDRVAGSLFIPVGKGRPLPPDFEPADLAPLASYPLASSRSDLSLRRAVIPAILELDREARAAGVTLVFSSSYRSYAYQERLFARNAASMGEAEANRVSARAGESQHQLGTVFDLGSIDDSFAETEAGRWMEANAWRLGFSLSFPKGMEALTGYVWESWHYRYLTKPGAALEREYFGGIQVHFLDFVEAYKAAAR